MASCSRAPLQALYPGEVLLFPEPITEHILFFFPSHPAYNTHTEFITFSLILQYKGSQRKAVSNLLVLCQEPVQFSWLHCSGNYLGLCYRNLELCSSFFKNTLKLSTYSQQLVPNVTASFNEESLQQPAEPISGITTSSFTEANAIVLRNMSVHHQRLMEGEKGKYSAFYPVHNSNIYPMKNPEACSLFQFMVYFSSSYVTLERKETKTHDYL